MQKVIGVLFLLSLIVSLGFGYFHVKNMGSMDMPMPGCPFMSEFSVVCSMSPLEHIEAWQHMFTAIPGTMTLILLLGVLMLFGSRSFTDFFSPPCLEVSSRTKFSRAQNVSTHNYLQEFFSRGILNPKLF
jgi:ABC-type phosphate transport system auxiliary subunit